MQGAAGPSGLTQTGRPDRRGESYCEHSSAEPPALAAMWQLVPSTGLPSVNVPDLRGLQGGHGMCVTSEHLKCGPMMEALAFSFHSVLETPPVAGGPTLEAQVLHAALGALSPPRRQCRGAARYQMGETDWDTSSVTSEPGLSETLSQGNEGSTSLGQLVATLSSLVKSGASRVSVEITAALPRCRPPLQFAHGQARRSLGTWRPVRGLCCAQSAPPACSPGQVVPTIYCPAVNIPAPGRTQPRDHVLCRSSR